MSLPKATPQWILAHSPSGDIVLDGPNSTFQLKKDVPLPPLQDNQVLLQSVYFSNDPAQRTLIWKDYPSDRHYTNLMKEGELMRAYRVICKVLDSRSDLFKVGQLVIASPGWSLYAVVDAGACHPINELPGLDNTHFLGSLGGAGTTAWYGLIDIARATKDDVVCVSGAAGATGSMVVQIAKHVLGCKRVIGIAGGEKKCRWVESLGADVCIDYKASDFQEQLLKVTEGYVNVFFDNVGGKILDLMLTRVARYGRIAACGTISNYSSAGGSDVEAAGLNNWFQVVVNRLEIKGFITFDLGERTGEYVDRLIQAVKEGKIKLSDDNNTVVDTKWEDFPRTWNLLFTGGSQGKLITKVVD
jgi:NADPH-dependent curcumin reductase CurA